MLPPPLVMGKMKMSVRPGTNSRYQLPSLDHEEGTATASSGQSESRRMTIFRGTRSARRRHNSRRASMIRRSNRIIELIDEYGNRICKMQEGRMNIASHDHVL